VEDEASETAEAETVPEPGEEQEEVQTEAAQVVDENILPDDTEGAEEPSGRAEETEESAEQEEPEEPEEAPQGEPLEEQAEAAEEEEAATEEEESEIEVVEEEISRISELPGITPEQVAVLEANGHQEIEDLLAMGKEELLALEGMEEEMADAILALIEENVEIVEEEEEIEESESEE
jgi:hypothetical protein